MSDPFDALRSDESEATTPDVSAIKARARAIERRRATLLSGGVAALAAVAVIAVAVVAKPAGPVRQVAQEKQGSSQTAADSEASGRTSTTSKVVTEGGATVALAPAQESPRAGADTATDGGAMQAGAAAPADGAKAPQAEPLVATIEVKESTVPRQADLTLKVCNTSDGAVKRSFGSAQRYDFEVKQGKELVWRWSDDRSFAQVTGEESWAPKACKTYTESWDTITSSGAIAPSGTYQAVGILRSSPELRTKPKDFCLSPCD